MKVQISVKESVDLFVVVYLFRFAKQRNYNDAIYLSYLA